LKKTKKTIGFIGSEKNHEKNHENRNKTAIYEIFSASRSDLDKPLRKIRMRDRARNTPN